MDNNKFPPTTKPEDYQLMYHSNTDGHIWVDDQRRPIPLTQQLTGHTDTVDPTHLWNSRVTKQGFHAVPPPISKGDAANSTAITQQPPPHTTPTSPIQGAPGSVPDGANIIEGTVASLRQDPNISPSLINSVLKEAAKKVTRKVNDYLTPTKPDGKDSNHDSDAKSETSETTAIEVGHMTLPPPDPKIYTQKDFENFKEKLEEKFRHQIQNLEKELTNQSRFQIETLNLEHHNQLTRIQADIEVQIQRQAEINEQKAQYEHTIKMLQQRIKTLEAGASLHTGAVPSLDPLDGLNSFANQSLMNVVDKLEKSVQLQTLALTHTSASTKEHYISSAKTHDGIDCKKFNEWHEGVYRLSIVTSKAPLDVAVATSTGPLHKYIYELMAKGEPWEIIEGKIQERFSEFGSPVVAQSKLSTFTQSAMTMHEYISEFTRLVGHAYKLKPTDPSSHLLATQFIQGIPSLHTKNKLRFLISKNNIRTLSDLFASALEEDQKQKIREIDFGTKGSQCEVHAIKGRGCYECGQEDHLAKDCPNKKFNSPYNDRSKSHHTYKNQKTQGEENSIEQSLQSLTDLVKTLIKQNSQPHNSYQKPTFRSNDNKYQNNQKRPHNRDRNRGYNNQGKYRNKTRINELGEYQSDNSSCSDQSEGEDEFDQHESLTSDESKN